MSRVDKNLQFLIIIGEKNMEKKVIENSSTTATKENPTTVENVKKQNKGLPPRLSAALKNSNNNFENVMNRIKKLDLGNLNDAVALENILRVLDLNEKVKEERIQKRRVSRNSVKIDSSYTVVFANDPISKDLINLAIRINQLNSVELTNIQENFLRNNIEDVMNSLNSSKNLVSDTKEVVSILTKIFGSKNKKYEKGLIFDEINKVSEDKQTA